MEELYHELESTCYFDSLKQEKLRGLCHRMQLYKYACNYTESSIDQRLARKKQIEEVYWDSINTILIPLNPHLTGRATGCALMIWRHIGLSQGDKEKLMTYALDYARRLRQNPCADFAKEEMDKLKKVLDDKQLKKAIDAKNEKDAHLRAAVLWEGIVKAHLNEGLDSVSQVRMAYRYYSLELYLQDYYVGQPELLKANLTDLYNHKPEIIKMYEGIGTKAAIIKKREKEVGPEFAW